MWLKNAALRELQLAAAVERFRQICLGASPELLRAIRDWVVNGRRSPEMTDVRRNLMTAASQRLSRNWRAQVSKILRVAWSQPFCTLSERCCDAYATLDFHLLSQLPSSTTPRKAARRL